MSTTAGPGEATGTETHDEPHGSLDPGEAAGHDEQAHGGPVLGPIDWTAWSLGVLGVVLGLAVAAVIASSVGYV